MATDTPHGTGVAPPGDAPLSTLVSGIVADAQKLITQQIDLVKEEVKSDVKRTVSALPLLGVGVVLMTVALLLLSHALVYFIHYLFPALDLSVCYLIGGGLFLLVGGGLLFMAINRLTSKSPLPDQSVQGLKENLQWKTNTNPK